MGQMKEEAMLHRQFEVMGKQILMHKYLYYVKSAPIISDYDYDMMELEYTKMAKSLRMKPVVSLISDWNELEWMTNATIVDFPSSHPWAEEIIKLAEEGKYNVEF